MSFIDDAALANLRSVAAEPVSGDVLDDRFELGDWIGAGAMGVVYAARDRGAARDVAVKILRATDDHAEARFAREVKALGEIAHPAVVRYLAHGTRGSATYLVTEHLEGATLAARLEQGPLSVTDAIILGRRIADGLGAVHAADLVHRDLKPSNIFLVSGQVGEARLLDFGLVRGIEARTRITATGALVGTPGYMSPEQVRGDGVIDGYSDIFSLGCVLHECLTGDPTFAADDADALLSKLLLETPPAIDATDAPPALVELVAQMLDKTPRKRPDANTVAEELRALETSQPTASPEHDASAAPQLKRGTVIADKYEIRRKLGAGGMGVVYEAKHRELGNSVAIKIMRSIDEPRFLREAQATSQLENEHARRVLDVGRLDSGTPFMVMEYLEGRDLAQHLADKGPLPARKARRYVLQACKAIAQAHDLGIVHRDLKPSNLFLTNRGMIKVLDFGISKLTKPLDNVSRSDVTITAPSAVMGSAAYMSPEQLKGAQHVDARSDIWSLGVVLHELIAGTPPFEGTSPAAVGARIAAEPPTCLRDACPDAPLHLEAAILRCLEKDPADRHDSVEAFAAALTSRPTPKKSRASWFVAALLFATAATVWALYGPGDKATAPAPTAAPTTPVVAAATAPPAKPMTTTTTTVPAEPPPTASPTPEPPAVKPAQKKALPPKPKAPAKSVDVSDPRLNDW